MERNTRQRKAIHQCKEDAGRPLAPRSPFRVAFSAALGVAFGGFALYIGSAAYFIMHILHLPETAFGWLFILVSALFLMFSAYLAVTRYGNIRLGPDDSQPEFSTFSWVSMMFATGMGIGLMFYGVSEPVAHFVAPPPGTPNIPAGERPNMYDNSLRVPSAVRWPISSCRACCRSRSAPGCASAPPPARATRAPHSSRRSGSR